MLEYLFAPRQTNFFVPNIWHSLCVTFASNVMCNGCQQALCEYGNVFTIRPMMYGESHISGSTHHEGAP